MTVQFLGDLNELNKSHANLLNKFWNIILVMNRHDAMASVK